MCLSLPAAQNLAANHRLTVVGYKGGVIVQQVVRKFAPTIALCLDIFTTSAMLCALLRTLMRYIVHVLGESLQYHASIDIDHCIYVPASVPSVSRNHHGS